MTKRKAITPTVTHQVRAFLMSQGIDLKPWSGLDETYAHKISLVWNPANETYYMFYNAVGNKGRGIGLITSKPLVNQQQIKPDSGDSK